jgi:peptide/histidine transporter 3/4
MHRTVYAQFSSFFILQGDKMDRTVMGHRIPAASLTLFDTLSIIILVPTYEHLLMPCLGYLKRQPTMLQRIGWGMVVAVFSMLAAAYVETKRKEVHFSTN